MPDVYRVSNFNVVSNTRDVRKVKAVAFLDEARLEFINFKLGCYTLINFIVDVNASHGNFIRGFLVKKL